MSEYLLDANVIVRFLTLDDPKQSKAAKKLILKAQTGDVVLHLDASIVAEVVYVLESSRYGKSRQDIHDALIDFLGNPCIETAAGDIVADALKRFKERPALDFADCWLAAQAGAKKLEVASFDRDLDKFKDITRYEPEET